MQTCSMHLPLPKSVHSHASFARNFATSLLHAWMLPLKHCPHGNHVSCLPLCQPPRSSASTPVFRLCIYNALSVTVTPLALLHGWQHLLRSFPMGKSSRMSAPCFMRPAALASPMGTSVLAAAKVSKRTESQRPHALCVHPLMRL